MEDKLLKARQEIDEIDGELAKLFERRMDAVIAVNRYKRENNLPVLDKSREEQILKKCAQRIQNQEYLPYYTELQKKLMELSRKRQTELNGEAKNEYGYKSTAIKRVGHQGVKGAFSHSAAEAIFGSEVELLQYPAFEDVFKAVENGEIDAGVIPFENSYTGAVADAMDLLYSHSCHITKRYDLPVKHNLLSVRGASLDKIKTVRSHPQALFQCAEFIKAHGFLQEECVNTAVAAMEIAKENNPEKAAIASIKTADIYGLVPIVENINTSEQNTTKFIVIEKNMTRGGKFFSIMFSLDHTAGELAKIMGIIAGCGFNMESIRSQSMKSGAWKYYFYVELCGDVQSGEAKKLFSEMEKSCREFKLLGGYD